MSHPDAPKKKCAWCLQQQGVTFLIGSPCCATCLLRIAEHLAHDHDSAADKGRSEEVDGE